MNPKITILHSILRKPGRLAVLALALFAWPAFAEKAPAKPAPAPVRQAIPPVTVNSGIFTAYGADAERRSLSGRLAALELELQQNRETQRDLVGRIEDANRKLAEPKVDPAVEKQLRDELSKALTDLEGVRRDLARTEEAAAAKERVFLSNLDAAVEDRDALKLKLQENAQRVELATKQTEDLTKQLAALQVVKTRSEKQVSELTGSLEAARKDLDGLRKNVADAEKLRLEAQGAVAEREKQMRDLNHQLEELGRRPAITQKELEANSTAYGPELLAMLGNSLPRVLKIN